MTRRDKVVQAALVVLAAIGLLLMIGGGMAVLASVAGAARDTASRYLITGVLLFLLAIGADYAHQYAVRQRRPDSAPSLASNLTCPNCHHQIPAGTASWHHPKRGAFVVCPECRHRVLLPE